MFALILGLPTWAKAAIVGVAIIGALQVRHWWVVRGLHEDIDKLAIAIDHEKAATVELKVALADVSANRDRLASEIRRQNDAIAKLASSARRLEASAAAAALRALRAGELAAAALREDTGPPEVRVAPGHDAMNGWLQTQFEVRP